jgi:hypothetical protein
MMPSSVQLFESLPQVKAMQARSNLSYAATVETDLVLLGAGSTYADSGSLQSGWFRSIRARDQRILWLFQNVEDAMLFNCKFDGTQKGTVAISVWQGLRD